MDLKHPTTKIPNPENETPPHHSKSLTKISSFSNGNTHHQHPPPHTAAIYKECLKNHAAGIGGHALDGCGEFMPSTSSLTCAACGCHRNFHRREPTTIATIRTTHLIDFHRPSPSPPSPSPPPPTNLLLSLTTAAEHPNHAVATPGTPVAIKISGSRNKRFRTKFSQEQKEKMMGFAEKIGWKMQRNDDKMVLDFCNSIGIRRGIFKVWMHNNKNTFGTKKDTTTTTTNAATTTVTAAVAADLGRSNDSSHDQETASGATANGSSSSS
uniref:zinc-finger homeodomain protein 9-like n=1 Tax=Erigeron canadensis TaxID=72917 RepID=UPI001CB8A852|nr:zinc-finger homeodomain protein 9-like [Erigeron canadensis]